MRIKQTGFTLVEMVLVMVLVGIIGGISLRFFGDAVRGYTEVSERDRMTQAGRYAIERMSREIRDALPGSVRSYESGDTSVECLDFIPIEAATNYDSLPLISDGTSIVVADFDLPPGNINQYHAAVYTLTNDDVYADANPATVAQRYFSISAVSAAAGGQRTLTLGAASRYPEESPAQRLYLIRELVTFCAHDSGRLTRHSNALNWPVNSATNAPPGNSVLLAEGLAPVSATVVFDTTSNAAFQRNASLQINLRFRSTAWAQSNAGNEDIEFSHEVTLTNAP